MGRSEKSTGQKRIGSPVNLRPASQQCQIVSLTGLLLVFRGHFHLNWKIRIGPLRYRIIVNTSVFALQNSDSNKPRRRCMQLLTAVGDNETIGVHTALARHLSYLKHFEDTVDCCSANSAPAGTICPETR